MAAPAPPPAIRAPQRWLLAWGLGLLLAAGIVLLLTRSGSLSYRSRAEASYDLPIGQGVSCVRFEIQNGTVGIAAGDRPVVEVVGSGAWRAANTAEELAELEQLPIRLEPVVAPERPGLLLLRGPTLPPGRKGLFGLELHVRVPASLAVEVAVTGSGHVTMAERHGRIDARTGRGDLRFERCQAAIRAETGRGNVIVFDHRGDLDLTTAVGDMQAFVLEAGSVLTLATGQGTVQCGVPAGLEFEIDARAEVGRIGADFGLVAERVGDFGAVLVGRRGAGTTKVVLRTGKGHLAFRAR